MDVDRARTLFDLDIVCSSEIVHVVGKFNNLFKEVSKLRFN